MTRIKVCGITNVEDARAAVAAGVDAIGLVFASSKRRVDYAMARDIVAAVPPLVNVIGVFMDQDLRVVVEIVGVLRLDAAQLHGAESPEDCDALACKVIKRIDVPPDATAAALNERIAAYEKATPLLDPGAGDGQTFDWTLARSLHKPVMIAGLC
ncbi:MAG: phosphoribosylanthranilate isomerase, partial [Planctomycetota bacterium]